MHFVLDLEKTSLTEYFTGKEDWVLINHVMKSIWTSSEITCAMFCIRDSNCQSINFESKLQDRDQSFTEGKKSPNCELNNARYMTHPKDFIAHTGYCYYHIT